MKKLKFLLWLGIFLILIAFASFSRHGTNPSSRFMLTKSLALDHEISISESDIKFYSGMDYALKDGKYYSDKPPGISFVSLPIYLLGDSLYKFGVVLPKNDSFNYDGDANAFFFITIFMTAINALAAVRVCDIANIFGLKKHASLTVALIFVFATLFWPYATTLFSHSFVAALLIFALYHLLRINEKNFEKRNLLFAGFYLGVAATVEYTIILLLPLFALYLLFKKSKLSCMILFLLPIAIAAILLASYNLLAFGSPIKTSYEFSTFKDTQSFDHPIADGAYQLLLSTWRGLFFYNPILLLAIPGAFLLLEKFRSEVIIFVAMIVVYVILFSSYSYFTGGMCFGPRHLITIIPLFIILAMPMLNEKFYKNFEQRKKIAYALVLVALVLISLFHTFLGAYVNLTPYPEINKNPIYEIVLPQFFEGRAETFLISSSPPLFILLVAIAAVSISYVGKKLV